MNTETAIRLEAAVRRRNAFGMEISEKLGLPTQFEARVASMSPADRSAAEAEYWPRMSAALELLSEYDQQVAVAAEENLRFQYRAAAARDASVELPRRSRSRSHGARAGSQDSNASGTNASRVARLDGSRGVRRGVRGRLG